TLDQAMQVMGEMQSMDQLESQLQQVMRRGDMDSIDADEVERLLGEDARRELEQLEQLVKQLEDAGYLRNNGDKLELTPAGVRKIGQKALRELFGELRKGRAGQHDLHARGSGGEHTDDTKQYEFGDPFELHLHKTVMNAVERSGAGTPVRISLEDFEVKRTEHMTQAATVLLIDQSRSMGLFGSFAAAKKVAIALDTLIRSRYPRDHFWVLGFSGVAMEIKSEELPSITWNAWGSGTNMQHAFATSRKLLSRYKDVTKQILMITDGEPTAHIEGGRPFFSYPPTYRTIQETLKEVRRCTQEGITINTFMLETSHYLLDFVDRLTRMNKGRALYTTPDELGQYVVVDYMTNRTKRVRS
ncbi:MAG: VWA domain-containing protein, partial [Dehalococcoidia bacterium]